MPPILTGPWDETTTIRPNYTGEKIKVQEVKNSPEVTESVSYEI